MVLKDSKADSRRLLCVACLNGHQQTPQRDIYLRGLCNFISGQAASDSSLPINSGDKWTSPFSGGQR
jgi:hypothetical protein